MEYVKAIAQIGNISAAAESLGISQPALSTHLKKIEKELGVVLFDRSKQPLVLTEAGLAYMNFLDRSEALDKELRQTLADIENMETGSLTIGGAAFFNVAYLPGAVAEFTKAHPGVDIEILDGNVPYLTTEALKGRLDLFITPTADEPDRFAYEELLEERVFLAVPSEWEINKSLKDKDVCKKLTEGGKTPLLTKNEFRSLCENTFIELRKDQNIGRMMESLFSEYGCRPNKIMRVEQTMTSLALTRAGVGISLITENSIRTSSLENYPALYMADPKICTRKMYVAYPRSKYLSRAATEFIKTLKETNRL